MNESDNAIMKCLVPQCLNMIIVKFGDQDPMDMVELRSNFEAQFKYIGNEVNAHGFKDYVRQFMKPKKSSVKKGIEMKGMLGGLLAWMETNGTYLCNIVKNTTQGTRLGS